MAKTGPKPYRPGCGRLMPIPDIAKRIGCSQRTIASDLQSALRKLRAVPDHSIVFEMLRAADKPITLGCSSVECDRSFIALYAEVR